MRSEAHAALGTQLLILALVASVAAAIWADRTAVAPNSDRYDYAGRARNLVEGRGPSAPVAYPLRFAFAGAEQLPPTNLSRPPLWPVLLAAPAQWGLDDRAGVWVSWLCVVMLLLLVRTAADRSFGDGTGGMAALCVVGSFAVTRALWGAGPELALAVLVLLLWTWSPSFMGRAGYVACGAAYSLMAWLHPIGIFYAGLAFVARSHRYSLRGRWIVALTAVVLSLPWYLNVGRSTHLPLAPLQGVAEVAKATLDPGGLGPYRGLEPMPSTEVLQHHFGEWLRETRHRLRLQLEQLDAWWSWPLVLLALLGARRDRRLALRDAAAVAAALLVVSAVSFEARLLVPLVAVAATWSGAGMRTLVERWPRAANPALASMIVVAPWLLPLGVAPRPGAELSPHDRRSAQASPELLTTIGQLVREDRVLFVDQALLAQRSRANMILLPDHPQQLASICETLGRHPSAAAVVLGDGADSWATAQDREAWSGWLAEASLDSSRGPGPAWLVARAPAPDAAPGAAPSDSASVYVPPTLQLTAADLPAPLVEIPIPPATRPGLRLLPPAWQALQELLAAARADSIELRVISAYRSYDYQKKLFDRAVARYGEEQQWVAAPGRSEHQLGTTVDLADAALEHQVEASFADTPEGRWLKENCERFDFVLSYTPENAALSGYHPEPWHIRFRGP